MKIFLTSKFTTYPPNCFRVKVLECSAKDDINIREIFRTFVQISRVLQKETEGDTCALKRRSSTYMSASKGGRRAVSPNPDKFGEGTSSQQESHKSKPRSRSLIRRFSRKNKATLRDAQSSTEECRIS